MAMSFEQCVRVKNDVLISRLEQESVILNLDSEIYFGLDAIGTQMLMTLNGSKSIEEALQALAEKYDVEESILREDLTKFIEQLVDQGLVEISEV